MPERAYAVVVDPERWEGDLDVLARRLGRSMGQKSGVIADMLERGAVSVDVDLRRQEAEMLCRRIARLDVPVAVETEGGDTVVRGGELVDVADGGSEPDGSGGSTSDESSVSEASAEGRRGSGGADRASGEASGGPSGWESVIDGESSGAQPAGSSDAPESAARTAESSGPTGAESEADGDFQNEEETESEPPALGELVDDDVPETGGAGFGGSETGTGAASEGESSELSVPAPGGVGELGSEPPEDDRASGEAVQEGVADFSLDDADSPVVDGSWEEAGGTGEVGTGASSSNAAGAPGSGAESSTEFDAAAEESFEQSTSSEEFDGQRMAEALAGSDESEGRYGHAFDGRAEHIPLFGALLSVLAPGAGQLYNGEEEKARAYARRFVLLRPWWESVRDAKEVGDEIHAGNRPKPEEGNIRRALRHLGTVYGAFFALLSLLWVGTRIASEWGPTAGPDRQKVERREMAVAEAAHMLQQSRIRARTAAASHQRDAGRDDEDTAAERRRRASKLFRIGHRACRHHNYRECAETMDRVREIDDAFQREAIELSTWAHFRMRASGADRPMPDIDMARVNRRVHAAGLDVGRPPPGDVGTRGSASGRTPPGPDVADDVQGASSPDAGGPGPDGRAKPSGDTSDSAMEPVDRGEPR